MLNCSKLLDCFTGRIDDCYDNDIDCYDICCYVVISCGGLALFIILILSICLYWQCRINTQLKNMYIPKPDETNHSNESSEASVAPAEDVISTHSLSSANQEIHSEHNETENEDAELKTFGLRKRKKVGPNSQCLVFCSEDKSSNVVACNGDQIQIISITNIGEDNDTTTATQEAVSSSMEEPRIDDGSIKVIVDEENPVNKMCRDGLTTYTDSNGIMQPFSVEMSDLSSNQRSESEFENTGNSVLNSETIVLIEDTKSDKILDTNITLKTDRHIDDAHIYDFPCTGEEENDETASIYASNIVCEQDVHIAEKIPGVNVGDVFSKSNGTGINADYEHYEIIGRPTPGPSMGKMANCDLFDHSIHTPDGINIKNCNTKAIHCKTPAKDPLNYLESRVEPERDQGVKIISGVLPDIECPTTSSVNAMLEIDNLSGSVENIIYISGDNDEAPIKPIPTDHYINVGALYSKLDKPKHANLKRSDSVPIDETNKTKYNYEDINPSTLLADKLDALCCESYPL